MARTVCFLTLFIACAESAAESAPQGPALPNGTVAEPPRKLANDPTIELKSTRTLSMVRHMSMGSFARQQRDDERTSVQSLPNAPPASQARPRKTFCRKLMQPELDFEKRAEKAGVEYRREVELYDKASKQCRKYKKMLSNLNTMLPKGHPVQIIGPSNSKFKWQQGRVTEQLPKGQVGVRLSRRGKLLRCDPSHIEPLDPDTCTNLLVKTLHPGYMKLVREAENDMTRCKCR